MDLNRIRKELDDIDVELDNEIGRITEFARLQNCRPEEVQNKDGSYKLLQVMVAKAQVITARIQIDYADKFMRPEFTLRYDGDSETYQEVMERYQEGTISANQMRRDLGMSEWQPGMNTEKEYIPAPGLILPDQLLEQFPHIYDMCNRDATSIKVGKDGLREDHLNAVADRNDLLVMITNIISWCNNQDALSKGESMTTAAIRKIIRKP